MALSTSRLTSPPLVLASSRKSAALGRTSVRPRVKTWPPVKRVPLAACIHAYPTVDVSCASRIMAGDLQNSTRRASVRPMVSASTPKGICWSMTTKAIGAVAARCRLSQRVLLTAIRLRWSGPRAGIRATPWNYPCPNSRSYAPNPAASSSKVSSRILPPSRRSSRLPGERSLAKWSSAK